MNKIIKNVETELLNDLQYCWEHKPYHRVMHIRLSRGNAELEKEEAQIWFESVLEEIANIIDDTKARFYICHDGDVFVIARTLTPKHREKISAHLAPTLSPARNFGLADLFEVKVHWPKLKALAERKLEKLHGIEIEFISPKNENLEKVSRQQTFNSIDRDLISSLGMRREMRGKTEIMIVEDDIFSQKLVSNALETKYDLSISGDGQGAILTYAKKAPDVLFLDIGLPDIDGHQVLEKIFQMDPKAYVVMFSGNGDQQNIMRAMQLGAKGFVGKPFTQEKLFQYIEKSPYVRAKQGKSVKESELVH